MPDEAGLERVEADARALEQTLNEEREVLARNEAALPELEQTLRERLERCDAVNQQVTELDARLAAFDSAPGTHRAGSGVEGLALGARTRLGAAPVAGHLDRARLGRRARSPSCASG